MRKGFHEPQEKLRRFYREVSVAEADGGFTVLLDGRRVGGPKGGRLVVPTRALAEMVAGEWAAQGETIELAHMPAVRLANTAMELTADAREGVARTVADYAGSDLLCYFAAEPAALVERQAASWGPLLEWAAETEGLVLHRSAGVIHQSQPAESLARAQAIALELDDFGLVGLVFGVALFGSAVLAIAVLRGRLDGMTAYELSRLDEAWTEETWGVDAEAAERADQLRNDARMLQGWFQAVSGGDVARGPSGL